MLGEMYQLYCLVVIGLTVSNCICILSIFVRSSRVGMVFLPNDDDLQAKAEAIVNDICSQEGLKLVGWRDVPVDKSVVGRFATATMPRIKQVLIESGSLTGNDLERELFLARKLIEKESRNRLGDRYSDFYICTLSNRVIVYKVNIFYVTNCAPQKNLDIFCI